jgi:isopentenyl phosphate kinase
MQLSSRPIVAALRSGLVPVIYGDVAFDAVRGGTIISTEEIMSYLATELRPSWLLLAGETDGVLDQHGRAIPILNERNLAKIELSLGGSRGTDVTGGMLSKVKSMLELVDAVDGLSVRVFSGLQDGNVHEVLVGNGQNLGTVIARSGTAS